jgi:O-antigen/teichoic acid export membrane protein
VFGARILSIFTGMIFLVMITGWLNPARFGFWEVLVSFVTFASYPAGWLTFWATREVARGGFVARTALALNLLLSVVGVLLYFAFALLTSSAGGVGTGPLVLAALLVPLSYWNQAAIAVAAGARPSAIGYSTLISEIGKLAVAYPALFVFKLEINGVILAVIASYFAQALTTTALVRRSASARVSLELGRRWFADSWIPATYTLAGTIAAADTVIAWLASGSFLITGYFQAAYQVGILVSYASFLSFALYPILLRGGSADAANSTLDFILMFGAPMAAGVIALSPHLLTVLSPAYVAAGRDVSLALAILAVGSLGLAVSGFFDSTLIGRERADIDIRRSLRTYLKSDFAFVSLVNIAYSLTYSGSVFLSVTIGLASGAGISTIVAAWAAAQVALVTVLILVKFRRAGRTAKISLPRSLPKYLLVSFVMALALYAMAGPFLVSNPDRLVYGLRTMALVVVGAVVYFGLLIAVDGRIRGLAVAFLRSVGSPEPALAS